jgi:hypothetical protein
MTCYALAQSKYVCDYALGEACEVCEKISWLEWLAPIIVVGFIVVVLFLISHWIKPHRKRF